MVSKKAVVGFLVSGLLPLSAHADIVINNAIDQDVTIFFDKMHMCSSKVPDRAGILKPGATLTIPASALKANCALHNCNVEVYFGDDCGQENGSKERSPKYKIANAVVSDKGILDIQNNPEVGARATGSGSSATIMPTTPSKSWLSSFSLVS